MPPQIRFTKGDLLRAAFTITRSRGIDAVNARSLARELGCSTQPIFRAFNSMSDVKQAMLRMAMETYSSYIARSATLAPKPYLGSGMAYILFAREERELFTLLSGLQAPLLRLTPVEDSLEEVFLRATQD